MAAFSSSKTIAAALLLPITTASEERFCATDCGNATDSYTRKLAPANRRAAPLVAMMISVSFRLMDMSLNLCKLEFSPVADTLRQPQQLGADLKSRPIYRLKVNLKTDFSFLDDEVDHAALVDEITVVTYCQKW